MPLIKIIFQNHRFNKIIKENFFIIDSNQLDIVESHMYGYSINKNGILTDNYYKNLGYYDEPDPQGTYVMVRKIGNEIKINQDFCGSYGIYIYQNKKTDYFVISNSFLLIEEYLIGKQKITLNKEFADTLLVSKLCSPSIYETLINEIIMIPANTALIINIEKKKFNTSYINYEENTIPLESENGVKIIDKWVEKWGYIFRSLKNHTDNLSFDLSGGYDSRLILSILLNSGLDMNKILIHTAKDNKNPSHEEDFKIASNISSYFRFKLNQYNLDNKSTIWSKEDTLYTTLYPKLGFHKEFYWQNKFHYKPRFVITGCGGEILRGYPGQQISQYIERLSLQGNQVRGNEKQFYTSINRLCNRSINKLKNKNKYVNDYEISSALYFKGRVRNHFGKAAVEGFLSNTYLIQPLIDPDIKKIKINISGKYPHDLIAYIYYRFAKDLIYFPLQGNRILNFKSIKKAEKINKYCKPYKIKMDLNKNYYIDIKRISPVHSSIKSKNVDDYVIGYIKQYNFKKNIKKVYGKEIYQWIIEQGKNTNFFPLRHLYALLAIEITIHYISLNNKLMKQKSNRNKSLSYRKYSELFFSKKIYK